MKSSLSREGREKPIAFNNPQLNKRMNNQILQYLLSTSSLEKDMVHFIIKIENWNEGLKKLSGITLRDLNF